MDDPIQPVETAPEPEAPKKARGWPKGKPRPKRTPLWKPKPVIQEAARVPEREPIREASDRTTRRVPLEQRTWDMDVESLAATINPMHIDQRDIPDGFDLQWVTLTCYGQEFPDHRKHFESGGWEQVHTTDFQGKYADRWTAKDFNGPVTYNGQALYARPKALSIKSRARDLREARQAVQIKEQQLKGGELRNVSLDSGHETAIRSNRINRSIEQIAVPDS